MEPTILFETNDYLVINKPSGLMVHSDGKTDKPTLTDWIIKKYPELKGIGEPIVSDEQEIDRPGIVHRLDEETSGVIIVAKTQESFTYFKKLFMNREIQKEYHAFVWGHFKEASGTVAEPIGRNKNDFRQRHAGRGIRGETKEAITKWEAMNQFEDEQGQQFSFMHLFPKTGRTHQLRVHMKFLQRPIVSDTLYAPTKPDALGFSRVALHARKISFVDQDGQKIEAEAPYPPDFEAAIASFIKI
ncbi:MAG: RluA family pseudouridine synthase [Patescibacteria group bacterium]